MAQQHEHATPPQDPRAFWEARYGGDQVWSGKVNATTAELVAGVTPGRSLDLGCGEGGDVVHLAEIGWDATGVDISAAAVARGREAAEARGVAERTRFLAADLTDTAADWGAHDGGAVGYDLITGSFFQSPVELDRERILRHVLTLLAPGGRLVLVSHAAPPAWATAEMAVHGDFPTPERELATLGVPAQGDAEFEVLTAEVRTRAETSPKGEPGELEDGVVDVRRRL
ncbi:class I SAM-dependent methyltransferase [Micrococcus luteus]|nr:class I SAM-dependent methyltransferase [Micrococcus luteus]